MERSLLSTAMIGLSLIAQAQLAPTSDAPLYQHLLEVNKEWRTMDPSPVGGERIVHFRNEAERIAMHLHMVADYQRAHSQEGLSATSMEQRTSLLQDLDAYADRGLFPQNHVLPVRNPIFIDPVGTACAVGQLMIESGNGELAQRIHEEMNYAYVHDMHRADVDTWAMAHGFTENELAWIQPGYPPPYLWTALGGGTNGAVSVLLKLTGGDLLVAGQYTMAGGTSCLNVARWNGTTYTAMGTPIQGSAVAAVEFNGDIYLGGMFGSGQYDLLRWNNGNWIPSAAFASKSAQVTALHVSDGVLYAAGASTGFSGTSYGVKRLNNGSWENIGQELNGPIHAVESFDGTLVCGGEFLGDYFESDTSLLHVARLDGGTWQQLGDGLNGRVFDLLVYQNELYAGGDCVGEIYLYFGLARIAASASSWEPLMPNIQSYIYTPLDGLGHINAMVENGGRIFLGGDFYVSQGLTYGYGLAVFNGSPDDVQPLADFQGPVSDVEFASGTELVAGGASNALMNIASAEIALGVPEPDGGTATLGVWPNPATETITIANRDLSRNARVELLDASGRVVRTNERTSTSGTIDVRDLASGAYTIRLTDGNKIRSGTFMKR